MFDALKAKCKPILYFNCNLLPHLTLQAAEQHIIYNVGREEYSSCQPRPEPRVVAYCTQPYEPK